MYNPYSSSHKYGNYRGGSGHPLFTRNLKRKFQAIGAAGAGYTAYKAKKYLSGPSKVKLPEKKSIQPVTIVPRRKAYKPKFKKSLKSQVRQIQKELKSNTAQLVYKEIATGRAVQTVVNQRTLTPVSLITCGSYETVLGQLRMFNPAVPGTLTQVDGANGAYVREWHFKSVFSKVTLSNNYQVPVHVALYCCMPKEDTSIIPITAFTNGLADVGNPSNTSPYVDVTEVPQFNDLWRIVKSVKRTLQPGQTLKSSITNKDIMYDPSVFDSHALDYQKKFKCLNWFVRVKGVLGHDTVVTTEQSLLPCGVDFLTQNNYIVEYDGGVDLKFIYIADTSDTSFTNGGVVSSKPVADNIGYSQA